MITRMSAKKFWVVPVMVVLLVSMSANAFASGGRGPGRDRDRGRYYYHGGRWHEAGWFWGWFATGMVIGTVVATLPPRHEVIYVDRVPYYHCDRVYYRPYHSGYIVVPEPRVTRVAVAAPAPGPQVSAGETVTVNVPNTNGSYTPITLVRHDNGYLGPQGEYYPGNPTVEQLRVLYGK